MTAVKGWTEMLARARERLISTAGAESPEGPSPEILASWRRSYDDGASASSISSPYDANLNLATRLVKAAEPVIGRVHEDILGSPITVVLADSKGKVLLRRSGERALEGRLDDAMLAPGFSYAEKHVGTNGIGSALEGRTAFTVRGLEHFNEALQVFACVGVPLRDPVTRRQLGVLDITTWADRANPAFTALARQAASVIEEGLLELSSRGARTMLDQYLAASRHHEDHVLAIAEDAFIGSATAVRRLASAGQEELWPIVCDALAHRDETEIPILSGSGDAVRIRMRAVRSATGSLVGALLEFVEPAPDAAGPGGMSLPDSPVPRELPGFSGLSPVTVGPAVVVGRMAAARLPVCLTGEPGVGKRDMVETVAARELPGRTLTVLDAAEEDVEALTSRAREALRSGHPVLVCAVDALAEGGLADLLTLTEGARDGENPGWLAFSLRSPSPLAAPITAEAELSAKGVPLVVVPPLRSRVQDLHQVVPVLLRRISGGRVTGVTPELMGRLLREPWPGNLTEVADLLREMVATTSKTQLEVRDLPSGFGAGIPHRLSPLEWMARDAIVEALRACGGDKTLAAESLGISRASIYRKIKTFRIDVSKL